MRHFSVFIVLLALFSIVAVAQPPPPPPVPDIGSDDNIQDPPNNPSCADNIKNQNEADIDCGGNCVKCSLYKICNSHNDCASGYCNPSKICAVVSCNDGLRNGNETNVDCGGNCSACPLQQENQQSQASGQGSQTNQQQSIGQTQQSQAEQQAPNRAPPPGQDANSETSSQESASAPQVESFPKTEEPKKGSSLLLIVSIITGFLLIASVLVFLFLHFNSSKVQPAQHPRIDSNVVKLESYISNCLKQGYSPQAIRQMLIRSGWPEQKINEAFFEVSNGSRRAF